MTSFKPRLWTSLSAAALMSVSLAACDNSGEAGEGGEAGAAAVGEGGEGGAEGGAAAGEAGAMEAYASAPAESRAALRLAHLRGFFLIASAQSEGEDAAAALAGQGMLEVYDVNPGAFTDNGVDKAVLDRAAQSGSPEDIAAALAEIEAGLEQAGGDPRVIVNGLVSIASTLYAEVINEYGVDQVEYQHALGMVMSAEEAAGRLTGEGAGDIQMEVGRLRELYPAVEAPETAEGATPIAQVSAQTSSIQLLLSE